MATAYIRVPKDKAGRGMIRHKDQDIEGADLRFETGLIVSGSPLIKVVGEEKAIADWTKRVDGKVVKATMAQQQISTARAHDLSLESLDKRISALESRPKIAA